MVLKLQVRLENGNVKHLELVRQSNHTRVYVNPDPLGYDEWEIQGEVYYVKLDRPDPQNACERRPEDMSVS
jgi:hypothetical protein